MKRFIIALLLFLLPSWTWAAAPVTYYVNSSSTGTGDGTTTAITGANAAFKTIAEVNAKSFAAGDSCLFNRGQTWREQLNPSSSGSAGLPITFGAYGSGAKPKILGSIDLHHADPHKVTPPR